MARALIFEFESYHPSHAVGSARAENNAPRREGGEQSGAIRCGAGKASHPRRKPGLSTRPSVVGGMERLGEQNTGRVQDCLDAAAHCEKRAASAGDLAAKNAFVAAAICWRDLAQCWRELPKEPLDRPEDPPAGLGRWGYSRED
jgi:hypothetical protein